MVVFVNRHRAIFVILILSLGIVWIAVSAQGQASSDHNLPAPHQGFLAPDFSLRNLDGQTIQLSGLQGSPVMVNFWASWCPPCRAEMPAFQEIYNEYGSLGFVILAVNSQESRSTVFEFSQSQDFTFPILLDENGEVSKRYRAASLPATFFINKDGYVDKVIYGGPISEALLRIEVEKLLGENH